MNVHITSDNTHDSQDAEHHSNSKYIHKHHHYKTLDNKWIYFMGDTSLKALWYTMKNVIPVHGEVHNHGIV